jgi:hypothetical protein
LTFAHDICLGQDTATLDQCLYSLQRHSHYWIKDSLGDYGFREIYADSHLKNCDFTGKPWSEIRQYLGNPNYTIKDDTVIIYRYRLNHYSEDYKEVGTGLLEVRVKKGITILFDVWYVDG